MDWLCTKCHKPKVNENEHTCIDCKTEKKDKKWFLIGIWSLIGAAMVYGISVITIVIIGGVF